MKRCKKFAWGLLAMGLALLCVCVLPRTAKAASADNLTFTLNETGDSYTVSDCSESAAGELVIPETYNGLPVTAIGDHAFKTCKDLTGIVLPNSITSIGYQAFEGCDNLNYNAYGNCKYLGSTANPYFALVATGEQNISECSVHPETRIISAAAFYGCASLRSVAIPYGVTHIGYGAFYGCTSLTSVYMPGSIMYIADFAFAGCASLPEITIPDGVTYIGAWAFNQCSALTGITLPNGLTAISDGMLAMCSSLMEVSVSNGVTTIGSNAFNGCTALTEITIPGSVTAIGDGAFVWCSRLNSINIPLGVTTIGERAFANCEKLETVIYCGTQEQWNAVQVAADNDALYDVQFHNFEDGRCTCCGAAAGCSHSWKDADCENPKTCTLCQETEGAALGHSMQETAKVDPTCETAGKTAILTCANCGKTEGGEELPAIGHDMKETAAAVAPTCETAGKTAILTCANCGKTEGGEEIPAAGHQLQNGTCTVCGYSTSVLTFVLDECATGYEVKSCDTSASGVLVIPETYKGLPITGIARNAFFGCADLTSVVIPNTVTRINTYAFMGCAGLTNVIIPNGVTIIDTAAFGNCTGLVSVVIPDSVTRIDHYAFDGSDNLETVIYCGTRDQWSSIRIGSNYTLSRANLHFHSYQDGICIYCQAVNNTIAGDFNGDDAVTQDDVVYLLLNQMFGEESYPLNGADGDVDSNGTVSQEDVVYLLLHTMFGETYYPLKKN